jgi:hypothetical protein
MPMIYITKDGAQVMGQLLDRYYSAGHPCFKLNHEDECEPSSSKEVCATCKHGKALQNLIASLHKAGHP